MIHGIIVKLPCSRFPVAFYGAFRKQFNRVLVRQGVFGDCVITMYWMLHILQTQTFVHPIGPNPTPQHSHRIVYELRWVRTQNQEEHDLGAMLAYMDTQLTHLIDHFLTQQNTLPHDRVGIILEVDGDDRRYGRTTKMTDNPLQTLFDFIRALLQSNEILALRKWSITVDIFRNPTGGVIRRVKTAGKERARSKAVRTPVKRRKKPSFLLEVQEVDSQGRPVPMSDGSDSESDGDLSDFVVSDGHVSEEDTSTSSEESSEWMSDTDTSCSSSESEPENTPTHFSSSSPAVFAWRGVHI